jgi:hypothetical protein
MAFCRPRQRACAWLLTHQADQHLIERVRAVDTHPLARVVTTHGCGGAPAQTHGRHRHMDQARTAAPANSLSAVVAPHITAQAEA